MNELHVRRLIEQAISIFALDLTGLVILTEAATGYQEFNFNLSLREV